MSSDFAASLIADQMTSIITRLDAQSGNAKLEICTLGYLSVLATVTLAKPSFTLSSGVLTLAGVPLAVTASATGTAARARIKDSAGTVWVNNLIVGLKNAQPDIVLSALSIISGTNTVTISAVTIKPSRFAPYTLSTAVGDGTTDDTTALQTALTAGTVFIPKTAAFYKITASLVVTHDIYSDGAEIQFLQDGLLTTSILSITGTTNPITIDGLILNGLYTTGTANEFSMGVLIHGGANVTVSNNLIKNCYGDNVYAGVNGATRSSNITVANNTLMNPRRCNVAVAGCSGIVIQNNTMIKLVRYVHSIDLEPNDAASTDNDIFIIGNRIASAPHPWWELPTSSTTAIGNNTLNFTSGTIPAGIVAGSRIQDVNNASLNGLTVSSTTLTTVVMSGNAATPGVGSGDIIHFDPPPIEDDQMIAFSSNFGASWGAVVIQYNVAIGQFFMYMPGYPDAITGALLDGNAFSCSAPNNHNGTFPTTYMFAIDSTVATGTISNNVDYTNIAPTSGATRYKSFEQSGSGFTLTNNTFLS